MKIIQLTTEKELRIFTLPLRQRIIKEMRRMGKPVTAKQIADRLEITPSAAQHHMKKLISIGLIEPDHHELINGIKANYMRLSDVTVSIGQQFNDETSTARDAFARNHLLEIFNGYIQVVEKGRSQPTAAQRISRLNDLLSGIVHITDAQADTLYSVIENAINQYSQAGEDTHPWEIALLAYRMDWTESSKEDLVST